MFWYQLQCRSHRICMISSLPCYTDEATTEAPFLSFILALGLREQTKHIFPSASFGIKGFQRFAFKGLIVLQGVIELARTISYQAPMALWRRVGISGIHDALYRFFRAKCRPLNVELRRDTKSRIDLRPR